MLVALMHACKAIYSVSSDGMLNLQSRCFFLGPLTSCVVALHTALLMADPVMLCCAAAIRSVIDWPDISSIPLLFSLSAFSPQSAKIARYPINGSTPCGTQLNVTSLSSGGKGLRSDTHCCVKFFFLSPGAYKTSSNVRSLVAQNKTAGTRISGWLYSENHNQQLSFCSFGNSLFRLTIYLVNKKHDNTYLS